jgi:hypothetical protein
MIIQNLLADIATLGASIGYNQPYTKNAELEPVHLQIIGNLNLTRSKASEYEYIDLIVDINDDPHFYEIAYKDYGYAIYDTTRLEFVEFSDFKLSPYHSYVNEEKVYVINTAHLIKIENEYYDVDTNILLSASKISEYQAYQIRIDTERANSFGYAGRIPDEPPSSGGGTTETYIPRKYYYHNLRKYGLNEGETCGYIAIQMILSYYDTFLNDDIIPDKYDNPTIIPNASYQTNALTQSPGSLDAFHQLLRSVGSSLNIGNGTTVLNQVNILKKYLDNSSFAGKYTAKYTAGSGTSLINSIKAIINEGRPVILNYHVSGNDYHASVAYGYTSNDMFITNLGGTDSPRVEVPVPNIKSFINFNPTSIPTKESDNYRLSNGNYVYNSIEKTHIHSASRSVVYSQYTAPVWTKTYQRVSTNYHRITCWYHGTFNDEHSGTGSCICEITASVYSSYQLPVYLDEEFDEVLRYV